MKQAIEKDINKINTLEDTDLEYHREIVNYLKEYDRFIYKVALSVKNKCRRLEIEDIKQQLILVILSNGNKYDKLKSENHSSYFSQISEKDILIDFEKPSTKIDALVRGLSPWQPTYVSVNNKFLKVGKIKFMENKTKFHSDKYKSGLILKKNKKHLWVLTGDDKIAKLSNLKLLGIDGLFFTPFFLNHFVKAGDFCKR